MIVDQQESAHAVTALSHAETDSAHLLIDLTELDHLADIFDDLRKGQHLCADDGPRFTSLHSRYDSYAALFKALGFELVKHDRGFYYFRAEAELGKEATQIAVFFFILVEAWSDAGQDIESVAFNPIGHRCSDLPHFTRESWRQCMTEAGVEGNPGLSELVRRMKNYGFTERIDEDMFRFRSPIWRFLDLCHDVCQENADSAKTEENTSGSAQAEEL